MSGSNILVSGSGVELAPVIGDLYGSAIFSAGNPGPYTLATAAPGIVVTRLFIAVDLLTQQGTAGNIVVQWKDTVANVIIGQIAVYVPSAAPTLNMAQLATSASSGTGYWYRSRVANTTIQVSATGGPVTAGSIRVSMNYAIVTQDS